MSLLIKLTGRRPTAALTPDTGMAPALADINVATALYRLGGMQALYVDAARQFQHALATLVADLLRLLQEGTTAELKIARHTLKGNTATVGLDRLSHALRDLEQISKSTFDTALLETRVLSLTPLVQSAQVALQQAIAQLGDQRQRQHQRQCLTP